MKILTFNEQKRALHELKTIRDAIASGDEIRIIKSIENVAELSYIIGGLEALKEFRLNDF